MINQYTLPLSDPQAELAVVGGKGASLARLVNAGLPVPDGFHITTAAYHQFVDENALQPRILEALQTVDVSQPATLEAASAQIGTLFAAGHIPTNVAEEIAEAINNNFLLSVIHAKEGLIFDNMNEYVDALEQYFFELTSTYRLSSQRVQR